jgi:hypothetical protein
LERKEIVGDVSKEVFIVNRTMNNILAVKDKYAMKMATIKNCGTEL